MKPIVLSLAALFVLCLTADQATAGHPQGRYVVAAHGGPGHYREVHKYRHVAPKHHGHCGAYYWAPAPVVVRPRVVVPPPVVVYPPAYGYGPGADFFYRGRGVSFGLSF